MKKVLIKYDVSNDLIECPKRIVDNFDEHIGGIYRWIENDPDGEKYKMICEETGDVGHWINTDTVLEYLNSKCIEPGEEKAKLIKENVSRRTKSDCVAEF